MSRSMCQSRGDAAGAAKRNQLLHCESESHSVMSNSLRPYGLYSPWNSPGQNTEVGSLSLLQGIFPTQGSNPGFPHHMQILYQLSKNTGVGSLSLLQWIFPTQELNRGLQNCKQILYQLSYDGSTLCSTTVLFKVLYCKIKSVFFIFCVCFVFICFL